MKQTNLPRRILRTGIGLMLGLAAVIAIWRGWPRERLLTAVARPIVKVEVGREEICWLSSHQCLLVTSDWEPNPFGVEDGSKSSQHWQGTVDLLNASTYTRRHLDALTELFKRETQAPLTVPENLQASPDGQYLCWYSRAVRGSRFMGRVVRMDGTHYRAWALDSDDSVEFKQDFFLDSTHLARMSTQQPMMIVFDLQDPGQDKKYTRLAEAEEVLGRYARQYPVFHHGELKANRVVMETTTYKMQDRMQEILIRGDPKRGAPKPFRTQKFALPEGATVHECKLSAQQNIVYHLEFSRTPTLLTWLHRLFPKFTGKPRLTEELWVSRADGGGMHEIGHVPIQEDATGQPEKPPGDLEYFLGDIQWLPDGKQISFVYRGTLYVAPAEPAKE